MTLEEQLNSKEKMYKDFYLFKRLYSYLKPELAIFIFGLFIDILAIAIYSFEPRIMGLGITFITEGKITELVILCSVFFSSYHSYFGYGILWHNDNAKSWSKHNL